MTNVASGLDQIVGLRRGECHQITDPIGRLMKIDDVCKDVGLCRAMIYRCIKRSRNPFPRPVKIGYASRWRESEIIAWKAALISRNE
jgi:prophage regulatory protein